MPRRKDATITDDDSSDCESDNSLTSFSDTESEPEVGYLARKGKRKEKQPSQIFLGVHQRIWIIFFLLVSAAAVVILCIYGDARQLDTDHVRRFSFFFFSWSLFNVNNKQIIHFKKWEANEVFPNLYIGDYKDGLNIKKLKEIGITHILTIALGLEPNFLQDFTYMTVRAQDHSSQDLLSYLETFHNFIDQGRKSGGVLVHCKVGQSRSAMVVTSYIMREKRWNTYESLEFLKKIRAKVRPRQAFTDQLTAYHHFRHDFKNPELQQYTNNYPNKAQITLWPSPNSSDPVRILDQPSWVKEDFWREYWDALVHHFMDFYNRYLRYYEK